MLNIEAVVVCYNYSDFLEATIANTVSMVDRLVVVTHPDDKLTGRLCDKFSVDCIKTDVFHDDGDAFNKGRAINLGLSNLRHDGWLMHLDADIYLPHRFHHALHMSKLNKRYLYGADRLNCTGWESWEKHKHKNVPQHSWRFMVNANDEFSVGARLVHLEYGYLPLGCFQLWHSSVRRKYPIVCGSAEHSDVLFGVQWPRHERILLPEFFVYHLESEKVKMGANWNGRKTKIFGPDEEKKLEIFGKDSGKKVIHPFEEKDPTY